MALSNEVPFQKGFENSAFAALADPIIDELNRQAQVAQIMRGTNKNGPPTKEPEIVMEQEDVPTPAPRVEWTPKEQTSND